ncbi:MAG: hypothetical protein IH949_02015 [Bacteroidetes bacterium]|nr:hypothetical protein [Bacteroidota bacterium]
MRKKLILPHIKIFLILMLTFGLLEYYHSLHNNETDMQFLFRWLWIYLFFIIVVNLGDGIKNISFMVEYFVISLLAITLIIEIAAAGLIKFPFIYSPDTDRLLGEFNLNWFTDMNAFAVSVLIGVLLIPDNFNKLKKQNIIIVSVILISLALLTGTRGSVIIILFSLTIYLFYKYIHKNIIQQFFLSVIVFTFFILIGEYLINYINQLLITKRFQEMNIYSQGRGMQIFASWTNFIDNPWLGVGYKYAAMDIFPGIHRSNFQYTQILASSGIFFFLLYMIFIFRTMVGKISYLKKPVLLVSISVVLIQMLFRRPDYSMAFLMFFTYYYRSIEESANRAGFKILSLNRRGKMANRENMSVIG